MLGSRDHEVLPTEYLHQLIMSATATSSKDFLEFVRRSKLVDGEQLLQTIDRCRKQHDGRLPAAHTLADALIEDGLLTPWHCEKLLIRKYKGFFLGKYKLLGHLGRGGMSSVFLAEHVLMQRKVAIKILPRCRVNDSSYLARFRLEAKAAAALDHPNVVRAYDVDNEGNQHYIVMEYVPGRDLQQIVSEEDPLDYALAANYIAQAAEGLNHAHESGLVHRDVKPANLLLDDKGVVKILDMGLVRFDDPSESSLTIAFSENVLGTADYLAPEQALNSHTADARADIYSLGCVTYFLLTGHPPFTDGSIAQRIARHQTEDPAPLQDERPDCPVELSEFCVKMMAKDKNDRYQSAAEVVTAFNGWLESHGFMHPGVSGESSAQLRAFPPGIDLSSANDTISNRGQATFSGINDESAAEVRARWRRKRPNSSKISTDQADAGSDSSTSNIHAPEKITPELQHEEISLMLQRRQREVRSKTAPVWIWILIAAGIVSVAALAAVLIRQ